MSFRFATSNANASARLLFSNTARFSVASSSLDLRARLLEELKVSMKAKDTLASTTIRSVLSEVYSADKVSNGRKIDCSAIAVLIRKACTRRLDAAAQFNQASRPDLAGKERQEVDFLARFLPPLLPQADIDRILKEIITEEIPLTQNDLRKALGKVFKAFYSRVDKASVDPDLVKRRAEAILAA